MLFLLSEIATILRKAPLQQENSIRPSSKLYSVCLCILLLWCFFIDRENATHPSSMVWNWTMNKVIVDVVNDFELKNIGYKISQPKKCFRFQLFELVQVFGWRYLAEKNKVARPSWNIRIILSPYIQNSPPKSIKA